jgi:hypothetical protein
MSGVRDERLSRAVIVYIWGNHRLPWPSAHPEMVNDQFGDEAAELLPSVEAILHEIHQDPRQWFAADLVATARQISQALRDRHPELTDEARRALVAHFTYTWK